MIESEEAQHRAHIYMACLSLGAVVLVVGVAVTATLVALAVAP